jgi:hypothetical protein
VHLNLAYRWFCRLGLDGEVPDHSTFSKNRHGRFRDCDPLRKLFETVVQRCASSRTSSTLSVISTVSILHPLLLVFPTTGH